MRDFVIGVRLWGDRGCVWFPGALVFALLSQGVPALAQIVPDDTLGNEASTLQTLDAVTREIEGGALRGTNLFHSFSEFNVGVGQAVYFNLDATVENVLSRVTGDNPSNILGTLGVRGDANLFLMNPNGIVFGEGASLDIEGSFYGTTAAAIPLGDNGVFSAVDPGSSSLLSVSPGVSFLDYLTVGSGDIESGAKLAAGEDLTLAGQNLQVQGQLRAGADLSLLAQDTVTVRDNVMDTFIAHAGENLTVQGNQGVDILALNHLEQTPFVSGGDLTLASDGVISGDAHFESEGIFSIERISGGLADFVSLHDPIISATGNVDIAANYEGASLLIESQGSVRVQGDIEITGPDTMSNFIGDDVVLSNSPGLIIRAGQQSLRYGGVDQGTPLTFTPLPRSGGITLLGNVTAPGGPVKLTATRGIEVQGINTSGSVGLLSTSLTSTNGGDIYISSTFGDVTTRAELDASSAVTSPDSSDATFLRSGNGGNIYISSTFGDITTGAELDASSAVTLTDSSDATFLRSGNGGDIYISSTFGDITTGAELDASSAVTSPDSSDPLVFIHPRSGNGGDIYISSFRDITTSARLDASSTETSPAMSRRGSGSSGNGGTIIISSTFGDIITSAELDTSSGGRGRSNNGGEITISSQFGEIRLNGVLDSSSGFGIFGGSSGNGGAITISSTSGDIVSNGLLSSASIGRFGNPTSNGGAITISSTSGNITLDGALISASTAQLGDSAGNGGAITISSTSGDIVSNGLLSSAAISPNEDAANGGAITLNSQLGNISLNGDLRTFSFSDRLFGVSSSRAAGAISIIAPQGNIRGADTRLFAFSVVEGGGATEKGGTVTLEAEDTISGLTIFTVSSAGESGSAHIQGRGNLLIEDVSLVTSAQVEIPDPQRPGEVIRLELENVGPSGETLITGIADIILNNVTLQSDANGATNAGNITFRNAGHVQVNNSKIFSDTNATGNGGNIVFTNLDSLTLNSTTVTVDTAGLGGNAGRIDFLNAGEVQLNNSEILSNADAFGTGGNITFENLKGLLLNGSTITTDTAGLGGNAGSIFIKDVGAFFLEDSSLVLAAAAAGSNAGNIEIGTLSVLTGRQGNNDIIANAVGGRGGAVTIKATLIDGLTERAGFTVGELQALDTNDVSASATGGLALDSLSGLEATDISSLLSRQGTVEVSSETTPTVTSVPSNVVSPDILIADSCIARNRSRNRVEGSFTLNGLSGLPQQPGDAFTTFPTGDVQAIPDDPSSEAPSREWQIGDAIVEPDGLYQVADGRLILGRECES